MRVPPSANSDTDGDSNSDANSKCLTITYSNTAAGFCADVDVLCKS